MSAWAACWQGFRQTALFAGESSIPVQEVRRLPPTGHQTAIITTARRLGSPVIAGRMFARWCQENFFGYMMQHFDIDGLVQYGGEELPGTSQVVNTLWRSLDAAVKDKRRHIRKLHAELGAASLQNDSGNIHARAERLQDIQRQAADLRVKRRETPRKVPIASLPEHERPQQLIYELV
jgi:hypothetical protein